MGMNFAHLLGDNLKIMTWTSSLFVNLLAFSSLYALKQAISPPLITLWTYINPVRRTALNILLASCIVSRNFSSANSLRLLPLSQPWGWICRSEEEEPRWWGLEMQKPKIISENWVEGVIEQGHCGFLCLFFGSPQGGKGSSFLRNESPPAGWILPLVGNAGGCGSAESGCCLNSVFTADRLSKSSSL